VSQPPPNDPAETYERYFVPAMFVPWAEILLRHAAPRAGERVLDVGCGTGIVARRAAPLLGPRGRLVALDANAAMLAVARGLPPTSGAAIEWTEGSAQKLPFEDAALDLVLCQHALQFFPDRAGAVREMRRVLAPGGRAVVMVLQALERHPVFEALIGSVARHLELPVGAVAIPFALSDAAELRELFEGAGFERVGIVPESAVARFPDPQRFVPLTVASSAAAVPAFAEMGAPERSVLLESVRNEIAPVVESSRDGDVIVVPMFAHVAIATA